MGSLFKLNRSKDQGQFPKTVAHALGAFKDLRIAVEQLEETKTAAAAHRTAAAKTAEAKFQAMSSDNMTSSDPDAAAAALRKKKQVLESWVNEQFAKVKSQIEKQEQKHAAARSKLEDLVKELVDLSHGDFVKNLKDKQDLQGSSPLLQDDDELVHQLELELERCCKITDDDESEAPQSKQSTSLDAQQPKEVQPQEKPIPTVTGDYEVMKEAIDRVMDNSGLSEEEKEALVGSIHQSVKSALQGTEKAASPPKKAPEGNQNTGEQAAGESSVEPQITAAGAKAVANATALTLMRKDTTQLDASTAKMQRKSTAELEEEELRKCAVEQPDGTYLYKNKKGKLETLQQRQNRLAHNSYVSFSRSFEGALDFDIMMPCVVVLQIMWVVWQARYVYDEFILIIL